MPKIDKYSGKREHYTTMVRPLMETDAWREISTHAQSLYVWLRLEWKGARFNNNGKIALSVRMAAKKIGVHKDTVVKSFHELQAKGFIVQTQGAYLGVEGQGKSPLYELTELEMPAGNGHRFRYRDWKPGHDFPIKKSSRPK